MQSNLVKEKLHNLPLINLKILQLKVDEIIYSRVHLFCIEMIILEDFWMKYNLGCLKINNVDDIKKP